MPFNELQRRDSWPPTIVRLRSEHSDGITSTSGAFDPSVIDENPISFFLTSPEDIDDFLSDEDLSAGIETSSSKQTIREISPSSLQRVPRLDSDDDDEDEEYDTPMTLMDFTIRHTSGRQSRAGQHSDSDRSERLGLGITLPENVAMRGRGRARVRLMAPRARGRARSLSARPPQSWREPSPDIWSIQEENEDETKKVAEVVRQEGKQMSSPKSALSKGGLGLRPKKTVRWADLN